ncbi:MAG: DUF6468 domain-containing protein [Methyloligellaceae bacterium]
MLGGSLGFFIEILVALLLAVTIAYCVIVNRKLEQLRSEQSDMRSVIRDLSAATGQAENAIATLRSAAGTAEETLTARIDGAAEMGSQLSTALERGEDLLAKLKAVASAPPRRASAESAGRAAPSRSGPRASQVGLGLLNSQRRAGADVPAGSREVG